MSIKFFISCSLLILTFWYRDALSQPLNEVVYNKDKQTFSVRAKETPVYLILQKIKEQSGIKIVTSDMNADATVSCHLSGSSLDNTLTTILPKGTRFHMILNETKDIAVPGFAKKTIKSSGSKTDPTSPRLPVKGQKLHSYNTSLTLKPAITRIIPVDNDGQVRDGDVSVKKSPANYKGIEGKGAKKISLERSDSIPGYYSVVNFIFKDSVIQVESVTKVKGQLTEKSSTKGAFVYALHQGQTLFWLGSMNSPFQAYSTGNNREHFPVKIGTGSFSVKLPSDMLEKQFLANATIRLYLTDSQKPIPEKMNKISFLNYLPTLKPLAVIRSEELLKVKMY